MKYLAFAAASTLAVVAAAPAAAAPSLGDTITCSAGAFTCNPTSAVVTAAPEFILFDSFFGGNTFTVDFSPNQVTFNAVFAPPISSISLAQAVANRVTFTDLTSPFTEATLIASSGVTFFDQSNVSLTNGALLIAFGQATGLSQFNQASSFTVRLGAAAAGVPEPATWSLMLAGFGMVGACLRSRRRSTAVTYA